MSYTYDLTKLDDGGVDQMRFELGDVSVENGKDSCALADEEYFALLARHPNDWKAAKYKCVSYIVNKMAFEVDFSADRMSFQLSQRYERFKALKESMERAHAVPSASFLTNGKVTDADSLHYFTLGMHDMYPNGE